jgi:hypothetical protein
MKYLAALDWPGNVRQLENICHWVTVMAPGVNVDVADLPAEIRATRSSAPSTSRRAGAIVSPMALRRPCLAAALAALLAAGPATAAVVGVLAPEGGALAGRAWESTRAHLESRLAEAVTLRFLDIPGLRQAVASGGIDFFIASSGLYVELEASHGASRIATLESPHAPDPARAIASAVLVRASPGEPGGVTQLRGRRVAVVGPEAFGGWQLALPRLRGGGARSRSRPRHRDRGLSDAGGRAAGAGRPRRRRHRAQLRAGGHGVARRASRGRPAGARSARGPRRAVRALGRALPRTGPSRP